VSDAFRLNHLLGALRSCLLRLCHASPSSVRSFQSFEYGKRGREPAARFGYSPAPDISLLLRGLLLSGDGPARPLVCPGVRVSTLTPDGESAAVPEATVASDIHETLDVHGYLCPEGALHLVTPLDLSPKEIDLVVRQILGATVGIDPAGLQNLSGPGLPNPIDIGQGDLDPLSPRKVNTRNTCHQIVSAVFNPRLRLDPRGGPG
jgi:hypothetical protein